MRLQAFAVAKKLGENIKQIVALRAVRRCNGFFDAGERQAREIASLNAREKCGPVFMSGETIVPADCAGIKA